MNKKLVKLNFLVCFVVLLAACQPNQSKMNEEANPLNIRVERFIDRPIITPETNLSIGNNINGPSLIKAPEWLENRLGEYYLYFAAHKGQYIRLAYADSLDGEWKIYEPGTLHIKDTTFTKHIASPDVHIDNDNKKIYMYYHGSGGYESQKTCYAESDDGINFTSHTETLGAAYWRGFEHDGYYYVHEKRGKFLRSTQKHTGFEKGPVLTNSHSRHSAVYIDDDLLYLFYSNIGDSPERIMCSTINITDNWFDWELSPGYTILQSETDYEGANLPIVESKMGAKNKPVHQLRDPAIYVEDENVYMLYSVAGERGIAIVQLLFDEE